jgi:hypothetical protein
MKAIAAVLSEIAHNKNKYLQRNSRFILDETN